MAECKHLHSKEKNGGIPNNDQAKDQNSAETTKAVLGRKYLF